jgi:predicted nucleotide-binding protein
MINLLIDGDHEKWETNTALLIPERCLREHITDEMNGRFSKLGISEINQIKEFPCIFAYEKNVQKDARTGFITDILVRQNNIKIDYRFCKETIKYEDFINLQEQLDMDKFEIYRTHWTIKNIDIKEIIPDFSCENKCKSTVFISYSYDDTKHETWVENLAKRLKERVVVIFDKDLDYGKPLTNFMEQSIENAKRVICIMTPNYKKKTDKLQGGVGYEYSIISAKIFQQVDTSKFIPLIRNGNETDAIPTALQGRKFIDMRDENKFESEFDKLVKSILNPQ